MFGMSITSVSSIVSKNKKLSAPSYTLSQMAPLSGIGGNVNIYMNDSATRVYMSVSTGNVYAGDVVNNTWTQATLASGSSGIFTNREFFSIVCDGTGQYVITCVRTGGGGGNGVVFYSSDYGATFTMSDASLNTHCFNLAMSSNGNYAYLTTWGEHNPTINSVTSGIAALYRSTDKGVTWTALNLSANGYTYSSLPCQVKCNSTGEYVSLAFWKQIQNCVMLSNYGTTILFTGANANYGYINSNPGTFTNAGNPAVRALCMNRTVGRSYSQINKLGVYTTSPFTSAFGTYQGNPTIFNTQFAGANTDFPWLGSRIMASTADFNTIICTDTGQHGNTISYGNVYLCSNGMSQLAWFSTAALTNGQVNWTNFTAAQSIPKAAWSGLCVNYNDSFAFANSVGNVYIYSKPVIV